MTRDTLLMRRFFVSVNVRTMVAGETFCTCGVEWKGMERWCRRAHSDLAELKERWCWREHSDLHTRICTLIAIPQYVQWFRQPNI